MGGAATQPVDAEEGAGIDAAGGDSVVQVSLNDLRKVVEQAMDAKLNKMNVGALPPLHPSALVSGPSYQATQRGSRSPSVESEDPQSPTDDFPNRMMTKTMSTCSSSSGGGVDIDVDDASPRSRGSPRSSALHLQNASLGSQDMEVFDLETSFDCDPRAWILAAGRLEKKRDGTWKAGWAKRFFVLSGSTLYYYLLPKRVGKGEMLSLLGDERGQIRVSDIRAVRTTNGSDGHLIHLECGEVRKQSITQSSNTSIVLRAATQELSEKWAELLRKAYTFWKQTKDPYRIGGGTLPEGFIPTDSFREVYVEKTGADEFDPKSNEKLLMLQSAIEKVFPMADSSINELNTKRPKVNHVDPYFALAALVVLNVLCYSGRALNEGLVWLLMNGAFLAFIVYYENLASASDITNTRFNRASQSASKSVTSIKHVLRQALVGEEAEKPDNKDVPAPKHEAAVAPTQQKTKAALPHAGKTMKRAEEADEIPISWSPGDHTVFKVRDVGYKAKKEKVQSKEALYDLVGMDILKSDRRLDDMHSLLTLFPPRECDDLEKIKQSGLPRLFVVNMQVPLKTPSPWGQEDPGISVVYYWAVNPRTVEQAINEPNRPEIALFKRFVTDFDKNDDIRRRFKGIAVAGNFSDLNLSSKLEPLNGKPVILFKAASHKRFAEGHEATVMVHKFGFIAKGLFHQFKELSESIKINAAFVIQGEDDSELPECLLGCAKVHRLDFGAAIDYNDLKAVHEKSE